MDQIAKGQNVNYKKNGSPPEIEVTVGSVAIGFYILFLITGATHSEIGRSASNKPQRSFPIGDPAKLSGDKVTWQIGIAGGNPTDPFTNTVIITQDGNTLAEFAYPAGHGDDLTVDYITLVGQ
jgi:hypothetical protein